MPGPVGATGCPGATSVLSSTGSSSDLFHRHPHLKESLCKSPGVKHSDQEGITPAEELCSVCLQIPLARAGHTQLSLGTPRGQRWAQLNCSRPISCSQLPPAPLSAKLSWKPCNGIKRYLQMIIFQMPRGDVCTGTYSQWEQASGDEGWLTEI